MKPVFDTGESNDTKSRTDDSARLLKALILLIKAKLLVEAADTATGVHHLLLASVEGVTLGAHFDTDVLLGGAGLDHIAAGAPDGGLLIVGVEAFLHYIHLFLLGGSFHKRISYINIAFAKKQPLF